MEPFDLLPPNALYDILILLEPRDLLALYLSDNQIKKYLDNHDFLDGLYRLYNIEAITFTSWIKKYNESLLYSQLYLYQMENTLLLPDKDYLQQDFTFRLLLIDRMRELKKLLYINNYQFGLGINIMDLY